METTETTKPRRKRKLLVDEVTKTVDLAATDLNQKELVKVLFAAVLCADRKSWKLETAYRHASPQVEELWRIQGWNS